MPGKHVRFSGRTTLYSPPSNYVPPPPPLTYNDYSPASSNSLPTPPAIPGPLPTSTISPYSYAVPPLSKRAQNTYRPPPMIRLHHILEYSSDLYFDIRQHPSTVRARRHHLPSSVLSEPATSPPAQYMRLTGKYIPWPIRVTSTGYSRSTQLPYVTVADVLDAIYFNLRTNVTPTEWAALGHGSKAQVRAKRAYEDRYRRLQDTAAYQEEKRGGMKRVDFLLGYNKFVGLTPYNAEKGEWTLHTDT